MCIETGNRLNWTITGVNLLAVRRVSAIKCAYPFPLWQFCSHSIATFTADSNRRRLTPPTVWDQAHVPVAQFVNINPSTQTVRPRAHFPTRLINGRFMFPNGRVFLHWGFGRFLALRTMNCAWKSCISNTYMRGTMAFFTNLLFPFRDLNLHHRLSGTSIDRWVHDFPVAFGGNYFG